MVQAQACGGTISERMRAVSVILLLARPACGLVQPMRLAVHAPGRSARSHTTMLAKKFKGGRLDDFLSAADAEAKYGPQRYAAVYDDLRDLEVKKDESNKQQEYSRRVYAALKQQLLADHAFLSLVGCTIVWYFFNVLAVRSYAVGAALGALYIYLSGRSADGFGATTIEEVKKGPPALVAPVLMVLLCAPRASKALQLLPLI